MLINAHQVVSLTVQYVRQISHRSGKRRCRQCWYDIDTVYTVLHAVYAPIFPDPFCAYTGKKLSKGAKSVTGATAGKVLLCAAEMRLKSPGGDKSLVLQKLFLDFLPGKVCVITGGGRGVGQAIAEKYASLGLTLILTARSRDELEEV